MQREGMGLLEYQAMPSWHAVLLIRIRILIRRIRMFLGLMDPDPDPLFRGMNPDPSKNGKKNLDSYCFVISFLTFYL
jgi:hypothetical protein